MILLSRGTIGQVVLFSAILNYIFYKNNSTKLLRETVEEEGTNKDGLRCKISESGLGRPKANKVLQSKRCLTGNKYELQGDGGMYWMKQLRIDQG